MLLIYYFFSDSGVHEDIWAQGVLALRTGNITIRMVTHLDVSDGQVTKACEILASL
jgi:hypothetical protein